MQHTHAELASFNVLSSNFWRTPLPFVRTLGQAPAPQGIEDSDNAITITHTVIGRQNSHRISLHRTCRGPIM